MTRLGRKTALGVTTFIGILGAFGLSYGLTSVHGASPSPAPSASPSGEPTASASPVLFPPRSPAIPTHTPTVSPTVTPSEAKTLLRQYSKAQDNEMAALKHRHKSEMKELRAAHKAQLNEWEGKERQARHKFFAEHKSGPDRRGYVQDYLRRREVLLKIQSDDEDRRTQEQSVRLDSLKNDQAQRLKEFQDFLNRGERPPAQLWPSGA
ncbi:MAG: hypothetical protein ACJ763_07135 [Bdellovibrionia bacterium]